MNMQIVTPAALGNAGCATETKAAGLMAGSVILTMKGECRVEDLAPGDRIITRDTGVAVLQGIEAETVPMTPVAIKAGSLGQTRPECDTLVAPGTLIHIRDWRAEAVYGAKTANVPAADLDDGEFIQKAPSKIAQQVYLKMDTPHVVYVDGLEVVAG